jgi:hypothetical protein
MCICPHVDAGAPLNFSVPIVEGYQVDLGVDFGGKFDIPCTPTLVEGICMREGTAEVGGCCCFGGK